MKPEDAQQDRKAAEIFGRAVEMASAEARAAYVEGACRENESLKARVEALLANHAEDDFLQKPAAAVGPNSTVVMPITEKAGDRIGRYKIREKVGEGGCGVVYVAEQEEPVRRRVALKIIKPGMDTKSVIARFEAERQALAMMDHPNIAKVFDAGTTESGRPFFVMELVRGIRITEYCDQNNLPTQARLDLFTQVCHAVQHAHQKGIIHRDIKPSNILVTLHDGVPVPKVIDFGIAKAVEGRLTDLTIYTELYQFVGTPAYMSPEQAEMSGLDIDTRTDIYSLGVLLYELLAGTTPFDPEELIAAGIDGMRRTIREKDPVRPSTRVATLGGEELTTTAKRRSTDGPRLVHQLKGDLDWIVLKCLEKDRTRRYDSATGLAMDLKRYLNNEPIVARPPSTIYRMQKAIRRHKLVFAAATAVVLALLIGATASTLQAIRVTRAERAKQALLESERQARQAATRAQSEAELERDRARRNLYAADINLAHQAWLQSNLGKARRLLARSRPAAGQEDLRGWEWRYLWGLTRGDDSIEVAQFNGGVFHLAFMDNDRSVAVGLTGFGAEERGSFVFDVGATQLTNRRLLGQSLLAVSAYFPEKKWLMASAMGSNGLSISVRNAATLQEVARLPAPINSFVKAISISRDGKQVAAFHGGAKVRVWRTDDWSKISDIEGEVGGFHSGCSDFLGAGDRIAIGWGDGTLSIHEIATGNQLREVAAHRIRGANDGITAMAVAPNQRVIATGAGFTEKTIKLWDPESLELVRELTGHQAWICTLAFSPDGALLASSSADQTIRLWDTKTWTEAATLRGHEDEVYSLAFSSDGRRIITGTKNGSVRLWQTPPAKRPPAEWTLPEPARSFAISFDGRKLVTVGDDYILWDLDTRKKLATLTELRGYHTHPAFSPDGRQLLVGGPNGKIRIWDFDRQSLSEFDTGRDEDVTGVETLSVTNFLVAAWWGLATRFRIWNFKTGQLLHEFEQPERRGSEGNISSRGDLAIGHEDGSVTLWNAESGWAETNFHAHRRGVSGTAFSPDARTLATGGVEGTAKLWDLRTQRETVTLKGHLRSVHSVEISPDGNRLATAAGGTESIKLWDMHTHQELITLSGEGAIMVFLKFSPDGNKIVGFNDSARVQVWRAPSWAEIEAAEKAQKQ